MAEATATAEKTLTDWFGETKDLPEDGAVEHIVLGTTDLETAQNYLREALPSYLHAWRKAQGAAKPRKPAKPGPKKRRYLNPSTPAAASSIEQLREKKYYFGQQYRWASFDDATPAHWQARIDHQQQIVDTAKNAIDTSKAVKKAMEDAGAANGKELIDAAVKKLARKLEADTADYYG
jgi:hypothetical protein